MLSKLGYHRDKTQTSKKRNEKKGVGQKKQRQEETKKKKNHRIEYLQKNHSSMNEKATVESQKKSKEKFITERNYLAQPCSNSPIISSSSFFFLRSRSCRSMVFCFSSINLALKRGSSLLSHLCLCGGTGIGTALRGVLGNSAGTEADRIEEEEWLWLPFPLKLLYSAFCLLISIGPGADIFRICGGIGYGASSQSRISSKIGSLSLSGMGGGSVTERDLLKEKDDERINEKALWVEGAEDGLSAEMSLEWEHCLVRPDDVSERPGIFVAEAVLKVVV